MNELHGVWSDLIDEQRLTWLIACFFLFVFFVVQRYLCETKEFQEKTKATGLGTRWARQ
jgi:hypothetical protein